MPFTRRIGGRLTKSLPVTQHEELRVDPRRPIITRPFPIPVRPAPRPIPHLERDQRDPYARHLKPDLAVENHPRLVERPRIIDIIHQLPKPDLRSPSPTGSPCGAQWNSVALFYNLNIPNNKKPSDYTATSVQAAKDFLDEGQGALSPGISESLCRYWSTLSYGQLAFGLNTPRQSNGDPIIPTISVESDNPQDWGGLIDQCLLQVAEAAWVAAGSLMKDSMRWIPSVVLVQNYWTHASATFSSFTRTIAGNTYLIGDRTHITYSLKHWSPPDAPHKIGRVWWGTLCHEYAHNFLEFGDLYGPQGCTGYWDLLGDNSPPGRMSEVSSAIKERVGWIQYKDVINGPSVPLTQLRLAPYTTTGEAYKLVPDPQHTPHEYFVLEFRKSTGDEVWRPDGALPEAGLLITHINDRLGITRTWLLRDAPFFDPEFADEANRGHVDWTGHKDLTGKLFPQGGKNSFTPHTTPSSRLYGGRNSGLYITDISVNNTACTFSLRFQGAAHQVRWQTSAKDRALAGRFTLEASSGGEEIFLRDDDNAALLIHRQGQWLVNRVHKDWIGQWNLGSDNRELVGDLNGDGRDEIYIRSPNWAGVLAYSRGRFRSVTVQHDWIDGWNLGSDNWEHIVDLDGDGQAEVYIRSPNWAGVLKLIDGKLRLLSIQQGRIDSWNLGTDNSELVGRFSQPHRDEIAIRSPEWLGLLSWDARISKLRLARIQHDWVDGWNLGAGDWHEVGDFDGDGRDEIFIRSGNWAGVLKWISGRFRVIWMTSNKIDHADGVADHAWPLDAKDRIYSGRFRADRDGILLRNDSWGVAILTWDGDAMRVQRRHKSKFDGHWNLGAGDRFVLGDFHRTGNDIADPATDYIVDGLTDVFIHNSWGTGMLGINHRPPTSPNQSPLDQIGITWIQKGKLMDED